MAARSLVHAPLSNTSVHVCVDIQGLFGARGPCTYRGLRNILAF